VQPLTESIRVGGGTVADAPREWNLLKYRDARDYLVNLRGLERVIARSQVDKRTRSLRGKGHRKHLEARQAALFCHAINEVLGLGAP